MLYLGTTPLAGNIKSKLYTTSGTFVVPADVQIVWIDGIGGGGGGAGGDPTPGGGGGGGTATFGCRMIPFRVSPGSVLTVTVGAAGAGGSPASDGGVGGSTTIAVGGSVLLMLSSSYVESKKGLPGSGGAAGIPFAVGSPATFGVNNPVPYQCNEIAAQTFCSGAAGGALSVNGGGRGAGASLLQGGAYGGGGTGGVSGGGGGAGGFSMYGNGGNGGSNGAAGTAATGYGAGGGGGSGNAAGGNGSPGFICIYYVSAYTVA